MMTLNLTSQLAMELAQTCSVKAADIFKVTGKEINTQILTDLFVKEFVVVLMTTLKIGFNSPEERHEFIGNAVASLPEEFTRDFAIECKKLLERNFGIDVKSSIV